MQAAHCIDTSKSEPPAPEQRDRESSRRIERLSPTRSPWPQRRRPRSSTSRERPTRGRLGSATSQPRTTRSDSGRCARSAEGAKSGPTWANFRQHRPNLTESNQDWAKFNRTRAKLEIAKFRTKSADNWRKSSQSRPKTPELADSGPNLAEVAPISAKLTQSWQSPGQVRAKFGRMAKSPNPGHTRQTPNQFRPNPVQIRSTPQPKWTEVASILVEIAQSWSDSGHAWANFGPNAKGPSKRRQEN